MELNSATKSLYLTLQTYIFIKHVLIIVFNNTGPFNRVYHSASEAVVMISEQLLDENSKIAN